MQIGFIGLGIMGSRMAANLQKAGYSLVVHNRTQAKAEALLGGGATWAQSPADVGRQVRTLFTMLGDPQAVEQTAQGADGFLTTLSPGSLWVDCSTVNPTFTRQMAAAAAQRGVRFLDAPVAGSKTPAAAGQLTFLVGGSAADLEEVRPYLDVMGQRIVPMGEQGMGASMKIVLNSLSGGAMAAFAEAMALGQALGLSQPALLNFLLGGPAVAGVVTGKRSRIETGHFDDPDFPLTWMRKDLQLASQTAYEHDVAMPLVNAAKEVYALAVRYGLGEADFSAIYRFLNVTQREFEA
ncbi:NAD(P)-dependent oxidoreductase [Candidatus Amarolinea aalborgensis]|uniref:NAD(P)-dependent oxidoreductase n=1 Tax=Candidatus Amarolinea aalborgensis TaxID=2249329 RepID=UPI003BF97280